MTAREAYEGLFDRAVRHRIALERYSTAEVRAMLALIRDVEQEVLRTLTALRTPLASRSERLRAESLEGYLRELRRIYAEGYVLVRSRFYGGLDELASLEAEFQIGSLNRALDDLEGVAAGSAESLAAGSGVQLLSPSAEQLAAIVRSRPLTTDTQSQLLSVWLDRMERAHIERAEGAIRAGFVQGETIAQLQERVRGALSVSARGAEALARTAATHLAVEVANESYSLNADLVQEVEWVAVLDGRTTPICRARDGQRYPVERGPRPPAHIRCRSTVLPILDGFPPPQRLTFGDWIARQPAETQNDILGPARARLLRDGGLTVQQFVGQDGRTLTLEQLRSRDAASFRRAGL